MRLHLFGSIWVEQEGGPPIDFNRKQKLGRLLAVLAYEPIGQRVKPPRRRDELGRRIWPTVDSLQRQRNLTNAVYELRQVLTSDGFCQMAPGSDVLCLGVAIRSDVGDFLEALHPSSASDFTGRMESYLRAFTLVSGVFAEKYHEQWFQDARATFAAEYAGAVRAVVSSLAEADEFEVRLLVRRTIETVSPRVAMVCQSKNGSDDFETYCNTVYLDVMRLHQHIGDVAGMIQRYEEAEQLLGKAPAKALRTLRSELRSSSGLCVGNRSTLNPPNEEEAVTSNLPSYQTSFVGREKDIVEIQGLLAAHRVVCLWGPAGVGKTRLAVQVTRNLLERYEDGGWFIDLARATGTDAVSKQIAAILQLKDKAGCSARQNVEEYLETKVALIVLDNCEHLLPGVYDTLDSLLGGAPRVAVIATSRETLGIVAQNYPVESLPDADDRSNTSAGDGCRGDASVLFADRANRVDRHFRLDSDNADLIHAICRRLDGMPLALELAAARIQGFSLETILQRLDDRFRFLTGGSRTAPTRQQTLVAAIDWSYNLLNYSEKSLYRRLSVFQGGWALEAAETVCCDLHGSGPTTDENNPSASHLPVLEKPDVALTLGSLVKKSMVEYDRASDRYRMLETMREFAEDRLGDDHAERTKLQLRHLSYFRSLAEKARDGSQTGVERPWLDRLDLENRNVIRAIDFAAEVGHPDGLRLATGMSWYWDVRGRYGEAKIVLERVLAASINLQPERAAALAELGPFLWRLGEGRRAAVALEESLDIYQELADRKGVAVVRQRLANIAISQGNFELAKEHGEISATEFEHLHEDRALAETVNTLGAIAFAQEKWDRASECYELCLTIGVKVGDRRLRARALHNLGNVAFEMRECTLARARYLESIAIDQELGNPAGTATSVFCLACLCKVECDFVHAHEHYRASLEMFRDLRLAEYVIYALYAMGILAGSRSDKVDVDRALILIGSARALANVMELQLPSEYIRESDGVIESAVERLGAERTDACLERGRSMNLREAVAYALRI